MERSLRQSCQGLPRTLAADLDGQLQLHPYVVAGNRTAEPDLNQRGPDIEPDIGQLAVEFERESAGSDDRVHPEHSGFRRDRSDLGHYRCDRTQRHAG